MTKLIKLNKKVPSYLKFLIIAGLLAALALNAGCGNSTSKSDTKSPSASKYQKTSSQPSSQPQTTTQSDSKSTATSTYTKDIAPILSSNCAGCHKPDGNVANLPLDTYANVMKQVSSGNPGNSTLIKSVDGGSMSDKLNSDQLNLLKTWVEQGAVQ